MIATLSPRAKKAAMTAQEFHFGDFTLNQGTYQLQRGTRVLRLERIPMELLILLVEKSGKLVSREEIAGRLWGEGVFLDVDHGINVAVGKIRNVLRDDSEKPRFVETVVGKGYRFAAPVTLGNGDFGTPAQSLPSPDTAPSNAIPSALDRVLPLRRWVAIAAVFLVSISAIVLVVKLGRSPRNISVPVIHSLVVLPLTNLSGDPEQEYLADGMTEELIGRLSAMHGLRVISRTSAMVFKNTSKTVPEIARELRVDAVVEGSVMREANQVRVRVQLIRGATDEHIWTEEYRREFQSILTLQDEVARTIAQQISLTVETQSPHSSGPVRAVDPQVYESYLKGRFYSNLRTTEGLTKSITYFQQATSVDPSYALAYCGMADSYALLGFRGGMPSKAALAQAKAAALKAVELDDTLADAHASLAFIAETHEWDWATAEREYKRALELNPGSARTHHWYAGYLTYVGRFEEGVAEQRGARELDPLSLPINNALAGRLLVAGRYEEALSQLKETLDMSPQFAPAHQTLGWLYLNTGKHADAIREFQQALQLSGTDDADFLLDLGFAYAAAGNRKEALKMLVRLKNLHEQGSIPAGSVGILYGALGDLNEAFAWLERALQERDPELTYLKVPNRRFAPLRHDARYEQLVRRVGLTV